MEGRKFGLESSGYAGTVERIHPNETFSSLYSDYDSDMERVSNLAQVYDGQQAEQQFGKKAEELVLGSLIAHEINEHFNFRQTSLYDDYLHGADLVVEPRNSLIQAVAAIDVTTNQADLKGAYYANGPAAEARPIGLDAKLQRTRRYTDHLAGLDPSRSRNLSAWIQSGGLHDPRTEVNKHLFAEAERLFLMKYYTAPPHATKPGVPSFVIGGPQTVISIDALFINKALQGQKAAGALVADLSVMEFMYCIQAEQAYLDQKVRNSKDRNVFFDTHYAKVKAWSQILEKPDLENVTKEIIERNKHNRDFREQLGYYAQTFQKVYKP